MNIIKRELKASFKSMIIWSIFLIVFIAMGMQKYEAFQGTNAADFLKLMEVLPDAIKAVFGMNVLDITSIIGYYSVLYLYLILIISIHAVFIGSNIINKEETEKTAEFIFLRPITRNRVANYKLVAALINLFILNAVSLVSSFLILIYLENNVELINILLLHMGMFVTQILFLSISAFITLVTYKKNKLTLLSTGILLFTFFLSMIIDAFPSINILRFLTPFKYFDAKEIVINQSINGYYVLFILLISSILIKLGIYQYENRDLNI
jgi:ABC-2 type transport system permease protein